MKSMIVRNPILLFFLLGQLSTSLSEFFCVIPGRL